MTAERSPRSEVGILRDLRKVWKFGWWARLDSLGHSLHLPAFLMRPVCARYEASLNQSFWIAPDETTTTSSNQGVTWTWSRTDHRG